jgi:hypothetical protein
MGVFRKNLKHIGKEDGEVGSLIDHMNGYPKLYNYTLKL